MNQQASNEHSDRTRSYKHEEPWEFKINLDTIKQQPVVKFDFPSLNGLTSKNRIETYPLNSKFTMEKATNFAMFISEIAWFLLK